MYTIWHKRSLCMCVCVYLCMANRRFIQQTKLKFLKMAKKFLLLWVLITTPVFPLFPSPASYRLHTNHTKVLEIVSITLYTLTPQDLGMWSSSAKNVLLFLLKYCYVTGPTTVFALYSLVVYFFTAGWDPLTQKFALPNSNFHITNYFKHSPNEEIF